MGPQTLSSQRICARVACGDILGFLLLYLSGSQPWVTDPQEKFGILGYHSSRGRHSLRPAERAQVQGAAHPPTAHRVPHSRPARVSTGLRLGAPELTGDRNVKNTNADTA